MEMVSFLCLRLQSHSIRIGEKKSYHDQKINNKPFYPSIASVSFQISLLENLTQVFPSFFWYKLFFVDYLIAMRYFE